MTDRVLWRKMAWIIIMLSQKLRISPERALDVFYSTRTCELLSAQEGGLHLMSDGCVLDYLVDELRTMGIRGTGGRHPKRGRK